jgi:hypothetical protein
MIFINNKYTTWYFNLISKAQTRPITGYTEKHHIIPKCLGGDNSAANIVKLTAREHFVCHRMLTKMVDTSVKHKLVFAAWQQSRPSKHKDVKITSRTYETLRKQLSETYTGRKCKPVSDDTRAKLSAASKGKPKSDTHKANMKSANHARSPEYKIKLSSALKGKPRSDEHIANIKKSKQDISLETRTKMSESAKKRPPVSAESKSKMSASKKGKTTKLKGSSQTKVTCPHCNKEGGISLMKQWHFDKCKLLVTIE